jgi:Tol biopolymer transport system component
VIGETRGHFNITARIGAGGMGEVYRATDTRLKRDVAIKVLPEEVARDPERLARFQREAELLASLNHPHIAAIHGLEEVAGTPLLVLELIEGADLSERLKQGPIPPDEVVEIARQIAEALEEAHERGIVHRDLKPANIKLTPDGKVKVLDFGLAKAWAPDAISGGSGDLSRSPTLAYSGTHAGVILGTAAYMSPEQARGKAVDRRADIWAFGVVLYEMLVGGTLFGGETATDIIASVVKEQPDWEKLPEDTPRVLRSLLRRCLVKDPRQRLRDIGDARLELDLAQSGRSEEPEPAPSAAAAGTPTTRWRRIAPWAFAAVLAVGAVGLAALLALRRPPEAPVVRFEVPAPEGGSFQLNPARPGPVRVSPDGTMLAFSAVVGTEGTRLLVRRLDEPEARVLPGTDGAQYPFWSPDSRHIAFFAEGKLKRVGASGGPPLTLCDAGDGKGGSWGSQGVIVFAPSFDSTIRRIPETGGEPEPVTTFDEDRNDDSHRHPRFLPDGRHFLYVARHASGASEGQAIVVGSTDGMVPRELLRSPAAVEYAAGHLFFLRDQTLMGQAFDLDRRELSGEAFPIADPVTLVAAGTAHAVFSVSPGGVMAWQEGGGPGAGEKLVWRDREGAELETLGDPAPYLGVRLSPDGEHAIVSIADTQLGTTDLWVYDVKRGLRSRFTFDDAEDDSPAWSPDGDRVAFASNRRGQFDVYVKSLGGPGEEELLYESEEEAYPSEWHPDGSVLALWVRSRETSWDIWVLPLDGERTPGPFLETPFIEGGAAFSPDGRWLAYFSDESGRFEVYVRPFRGPGRQWQVSSEGGAWPHWTRGGREIVYHGLDGRVVAAPVEVRGDSLIIGAVEALFETRPAGPEVLFDVTTDGRRFLNRELVAEQTDPRPLSVLVSWPAALERR